MGRGATPGPGPRAYSVHLDRLGIPVERYFPDLSDVLTRREQRWLLREIQYSLQPRVRGLRGHLREVYGTVVSSRGSVDGFECGDEKSAGPVASTVEDMGATGKKKTHAKTTKGPSALSRLLLAIFIPFFLMMLLPYLRDTARDIETARNALIECRNDRIRDFRQGDANEICLDTLVPVERKDIVDCFIDYKKAHGDEIDDAGYRPYQKIFFAEKYISLALNAEERIKWGEEYTTHTREEEGSENVTNEGKKCFKIMSHDTDKFIVNRLPFENITILPRIRDTIRCIIVIATILYSVVTHEVSERRRIKVLENIYAYIFKLFETAKNERKKKELLSPITEPHRANKVLNRTLSSEAVKELVGRRVSFEVKYPVIEVYVDKDV